MGQARIKKLNRVFEPDFAAVRRVFLAQQKHLQCCEPEDRCSEYEQDAVPTLAEQAAAKALQEIRARSFFGRNPELGKMISCPVCNRRHRESIHHEQKFATRWTVVDGQKVFTDEQLIAGKTPETETVIEEKKIRLVVGARPFKGKRQHPPLNKRSNEFVQLVRDLLPDEYTHEQLEKARHKIKRFLVRKYGRHGFLPPEWQSRKEQKTNAQQTT